MVLSMRMKQIRRIDRHRAVEINWNIRQAARRLHFPEMIEKRLRSADGERGDDYGASALHRALDDDAKQLCGISRLMNSIAISRFDDDVVGVRDRLGIRQHTVVVTAKVA